MDRKSLARTLSLILICYTNNNKTRHDGVRKKDSSAREFQALTFDDKEMSNIKSMNLEPSGRVRKRYLAELDTGCLITI